MSALVTLRSAKHDPEKCAAVFGKIMLKKHDPEKCAAVFGKIMLKKHDPEKRAAVFGKIMLKSMIPKSVQRFSEKIMLKQEASVARTEGARNPGKASCISSRATKAKLHAVRPLAATEFGRIRQGLVLVS